jgi:ribosome-associated GTPase EngA
MPSAHSIPKVALLGRPNVGKSTLFNRLIRSKRAITHDRPGVTRDRMEGIVRAKGLEPFLLVDTGGVTLDSHQRVEEGPEGIRGFEAAILAQAKEAVRESDLLCLVVDARDGLTPLDDHLATFLRKQGKDIMLIVNKVDGPEKQDILLAEFHALGMEMFACSAEHGYNVRNLEDEIRFKLFSAGEEEESAIPEDGILFEGASRRQRKKLVQALREQAAEENLEAAEVTGAGEENDSETSDHSQADAFDSDSDAFEAEEYDASPLEREEDGSEAALLPGGSTHREQAFIGIDGELYSGEVEELAAEETVAAPEAAPVYAGPEVYSGPLRLAMLGRPNAGKSSLVNALVGEARMIVSDVAGTTRDSVDVSAEIGGEPCVFVDTAGVRRRSKIIDTVERYSVNSSLKSTSKAHVTLLVLDSSEGLTLQDKRLIDLLHERKTPFMLLVNKSDLIEHKQRKETEKLYREALVFCPHVPLLFVSARNRYNLHKIVPLARDIRRECGLRVSTGMLNRTMSSVLERHQAPMVKGVRPKFFYLTQAESLPPTFVFFVNDAERIKPSYARYIERAMRKLFGIRHAPMRVNFRSSHSKKSKKR